MIPITLQPAPPAGVYALYYPIVFYAGGNKFVIPAGFRTDGASIPRPAWITTGTPFDPRHIRAAIYHDYLYQAGAIPRIRADILFRSTLLADGVSGYQAGKMYWALRLFGWMAWRRYRKGK
jgi:hypothetical protein